MWVIFVAILVALIIIGLLVAIVDKAKNKKAARVRQQRQRDYADTMKTNPCVQDLVGKMVSRSEERIAEIRDGDSIFETDKRNVSLTFYQGYVHMIFSLANGSRGHRFSYAKYGFKLQSYDEQMALGIAVTEELAETLSLTFTSEGNCYYVADITKYFPQKQGLQSLI